MRLTPLLLLASALHGGDLDIPAATLQDKIRGGLLGQIIGDLNGLKHEMKYIDEPGNVTAYTPALPEGAWTDDDTDIEWIYIVRIQRSKELLLSPHVIAEEWKKHINRRFWCSHQYLRQMMDVGLLPPDTGRSELNPWADFNLSGQFVSETWGLISPGMPQTAARLGSYYTRVSIDGEALQSTQMFAAMIATAYASGDANRILDAGMAAVDPGSIMRKIAADVRAWHKANPTDWRATRKAIQQKYCYFGGHDVRDRNGVQLNGAATLAALLYGGGDFVETLRHAFNFGWDADNNAATAGAIVGVIKGEKWLKQQGWTIADRFKNTSRDSMPEDETITSFGDRMVALMTQVIAEHGGQRTGGSYHIKTETPANVEPLRDAQQRRGELTARLGPEIEQAVKSSEDAQELARAAYLAICLDRAAALQKQYPERWPRAVAALQQYPKLLQVMFYQSQIPAGDRIREKALAAGVARPAQSKVW
jgi:ADP-ribosylglycohydrolase